LRGIALGSGRPTGEVSLDDAYRIADRIPGANCRVSSPRQAEQLISLRLTGILVNRVTHHERLDDQDAQPRGPRFTLPGRVGRE